MSGGNGHLPAAISTRTARVVGFQDAAVGCAAMRAASVGQPASEDLCGAIIGVADSFGAERGDAVLDRQDPTRY